VSQIPLKPCPFCGPREDFPPYVEQRRDNGFWEIHCGYCESRTCDFSDPRDAANHWNKRPQEKT
jgi:hypothetical protein